MLRVGFIGAGGVNFGSAEGPWDHASRVEKIGGNIRIVGIAEPDTKRAENVLQRRRQGSYAHMYEETSIRSTFHELIELDRPDVVFIGLPPHCHGLTEPPYNVECVCADAGVHMFIEKPISAYQPEQLEKTVQKIHQARMEKNLVTSVGYMFRYSRAVDKMKEIIKEEARKRGLDKGNHITTVVAKYNCAYSLIDKSSWWDVRTSGGPIVEQCTHFVDLVRYITESECVESSLTAMSIFSEHPTLGQLVDVARHGESTELVDSKIPVEHRVPRSTTALWRLESGAMCQLSHGALLHGSKYESEIEVWADGLRITLENPYTMCRLRVRRSRSDDGNGDEAEIIDFGDGSDDPSADPYYNEVKCFLDAVRTGDHSLIKSSYEDAHKTYQLTWDITNAAQKNRN